MGIPIAARVYGDRATRSVSRQVISGYLLAHPVLATIFDCHQEALIGGGERSNLAKFVHAFTVGALGDMDRLQTISGSLYDCFSKLGGTLEKDTGGWKADTYEAMDPHIIRYITAALTWIPWKVYNCLYSHNLEAFGNKTIASAQKQYATSFAAPAMRAFWTPEPMSEGNQLQWLQGEVNCKGEVLPSAYQTFRTLVSDNRSAIDEAGWVAKVQLEKLVTYNLPAVIAERFGLPDSDTMQTTLVYVRKSHLSASPKSRYTDDFLVLYGNSL